MKKQVIVLTFNGENPKTMEEASTSLIFPGLSARRNIDNSKDSQKIGSQKSPIHPFLPVPTSAGNPNPQLPCFIENSRQPFKPQEQKQEEGDSYRDLNERVESGNAGHAKCKKKKNKSKTDFEIKNVLQQISSSIQSCVKDGYVYQLTDQYMQKLVREGQDERVADYRKNMARMQFLLENPTEYNFGCLLKMGQEIHLGLDFIFRSRILKKYIQCSKIRTLKQKSICLEAVDYLFRCFKEQEICSLHTWAHRRDEKLENKIQRLRLRCEKKVPATSTN